MRHQKLQVLIHFVWTTAQRTPCIVPEIERDLYHYIGTLCRRDGCVVAAIGGTDDHVHLLVYLGHSVTIGQFMHHIKGSSSHCANRLLGYEKTFQWQTGYGAFGVSPRHKQQVIAYIQNQKAHHERNDKGTTSGPPPKPSKTDGG